ncbi:MAG: TAXI family TRAP transporter solute-binding subunit, partial [Xanthobacteraceae bacterium]
MNFGSLEHMVRGRVRMFLRNTVLVTIVGTIVLGAAVWAGIYYTAERDRLRIAAGPLDARFVGVLSDQIANEHRDLHLELVATSSTQGAAQAMTKGQADLAVLPSDLDDTLNWPVVAMLRQNVIALVVPAAAPAAKPKPEETAAATKPAKGGKETKSKSGKGDKTTKAAKGKSGKAAKIAKSDDSDSSSDRKFGKVADLAGKRVGIVTGNEATRGLLELALSHYGVPLDKVTISEIDLKDVATAVKANKIDALLVAGPATGRAISEVVAAATQNGVAPNFIEIDQADGIAKRDPAFASDTIDAGTFGGSPPSPSDDLKTLSFAEYLVARRSVSSSTIATLSKVIYTSRQAIAAALPREAKIEAPATDKDADIVTHPGALAYLTDSTQTFWDRYGDDIFYGLLIFPVFGSAIAGVASYLRSDTRTRRLRLLQKVLDMVRKAHTAQNLEALEQLQLDADNLVIAIVHQSEHEEFDETVRMSFSFALDQLRFAIAARRTAILDRAGAGADEAAPVIALGGSG